MKTKNLLTVVFFLMTCFIKAQNEFDIGKPSTSTVSSAESAQNSINESIGKLSFSLPIASISASSIEFGLKLNYDGQSAFKIGKEKNQYSPTSESGVGWNLNNIKILVDNKNTSVQDDDDFYLVDGNTNTKLICTKKDVNVWEFQMEKFAPWVIKYYKGFSELVQIPPFNNWVSVYRKSDYWSIVKSDGFTYYYGYADRFPYGTSAPNSITKSKEFVVAWGNWIGNSKEPNGLENTIVWNLSRIEDQWHNKLDFEYELQESLQSGSVKQTEGSYLKKITSSNGANIVLTYGFKDFYEYFEPHTEKSEPDAYQERYEKKYLQNIKTYNSVNEIISTFTLGYDLNGSGSSIKRYLKSFKQESHKNGQIFNYTTQDFEYYLTGQFQGGLKKITYPQGGSVIYNYSNKFLFDNTPNRYETPFSPPSGYISHSTVIKDNYSIYIYRTSNPVSDNKYRFKFFRFTWNGEVWKKNEFTFPHLMADEYNVPNALKHFYAELGDNFYGFAYDKGDRADLYLFHLENDGITWNYFTHSDLPIGGNDDDDDPIFLSGEDFVALGGYKNGKLFNYNWNGSGWNFKKIEQGAGTYYMSATNNFIVSLDEDGNDDMVTGLNHQDNYYFHYLDAERKWQTKSWSAFADPYINGIVDPSYFYPSNSFIGFMADNNNEILFRWNTDYDLAYVDNNVLGQHVDQYPMIPVNNSMFTIYKNDNGGSAQISARFNGNNWSVFSLPSSSNDLALLNFGEDIMTFQNHSYYHTSSVEGVGYYLYSPYYNNWNYNLLKTYPWSMKYNKLSAINSEFIVAGNDIFKRSTLGGPTIPFSVIGSLSYNNYFTYSDGLSHAFIKQYTTGQFFQNGRFYFVDKNNGLLQYIDVGRKQHLRNITNKFDGFTPFMSPKSIMLKEDDIPNNRHIYRIIDDKLNNSVYDVVLDNIEINNANGNINKIQYTYNNPKSSADNLNVVYGEVISENKGNGNANVGKIKTIYNNGSSDAHLAGIPLEKHIIDAQNTTKQITKYTWSKNLKYLSSPSGLVGLSFYLAIVNKKEELFLNGQIVTSNTYNTYNNNGQLNSTSTTNSKGESESQEFIYAHQQYTFVYDKNMISHPYQTKTKLNGNLVNVERVLWVNSNGKAYINQNFSGPNENLIRLNSEITYINLTNGNVLENHNGKGIYSSLLEGYNNLYEVATISNVKHLDVLSQLDVTYAQLQTLSTASLKLELMKLYDRIPNAMINLSFYDDNGRVISRVNERKEESFIYYDVHGRIEYITDFAGNVLKKKEYNFAN